MREAAIKPYPLGPRQIALLTCMAQASDPRGRWSLSLGDLAVRGGFIDRWGLAHEPNCRAAIRALERRGYIRVLRREDCGKKRAKVWRLTRAGRDALEQTKGRMG